MTHAPLILDFDDSTGDVPGAYRFALADWQETIRFGCGTRQLQRLMRHLQPSLPPDYGTVLMKEGHVWQGAAQWERYLARNPRARDADRVKSLLTEQTVRVWAEILKRVPGARLVIDSSSYKDEGVREALVQLDREGLHDFITHVETGYLIDVFFERPGAIFVIDETRRAHQQRIGAISAPVGRDYHHGRLGQLLDKFAERAGPVIPLRKRRVELQQGAFEQPELRFDMQ